MTNEHSPILPMGPQPLHLTHPAERRALHRVLMVDDDINLLRGMQRLLRGRFDLTVMDSPVDALALLEQDADFAVIVSDYHMPGMTGVEFLAGALVRAPDSVRILLTGSSDMSTAVEAINVGQVFRSIGKPMRADDVSATLDAACSEYLATTSDRDELHEMRTIRAADAETSAVRHFDIEQAICSGMSTVFQPIVRLDGQTIVGHEALSRFAGDPARTPDRWFDEAAAIGLGVELDTAAIRLALENWTRRGPDGQSLWLNLSPATVLSGAAHGDLLNADVPLMLEITERLPVEDYEELRTALSPLRKNGISLAIDDVGAGYSSLRHIAELRPDVVKLDRSIISGLTEDDNRRALVASLISFANASGMTPLGEGIETSDEARVLVGLGAGLGQGYHFGRPGEQPLIGRTNAAIADAAPSR